MKILVTGGAGFIGSHLVKALDNEGHEVFVIDNLSSGKRENLPSHIPLVVADVQNICSVEGLPETVDAVFHLAAQMDVRHSVADPVNDAEINVLGTVDVLQYAVKAGAKRFVFSSSGGAIYGPANEIPTPETHPVASSSPYGIAKYSAEQYVQLFARLHDLHPVILRYANVYGPGQAGSRESGVIAIFCQRALLGEPIVIFGDGEQTRDFVYVDDVVQANLLALTTTESDSFNIATSTETTINELAKILQSSVSHPLKVVHEPAKKGEERRSCLAIHKAKTKLGWEPKVSLEEGLKRTLEATEETCS